MPKTLPAVLLLALLTTACAADGPPAGGRPGGGGGGRHGDGFAGRPQDDDPEGARAASLFISPCGEPFRGQRGQPYPVAAWFKQADANGDGKIDQAEFVADAERFFPRLDLNRDGVIDGQEIQAYETQMAPEILLSIRRLGALETGLIRVQFGGGGGGGGGGGRGGGRRGRQGGGAAAGGGSFQQGPKLSGAAPYNLLAEPEPVAASDVDLSGRISLANFRARAAQRFATLDKMGQGYLVLAQLPKTEVQQLAERRRGRPQAGGPDVGRAPD